MHDHANQAIWQVPHEREDGAMLLSFHLKEDVPLRRILQFIDASQGLCDFDGVSFRGRLLLPNIYEVCQVIIGYS